MKVNWTNLYLLLISTLTVIGVVLNIRITTQFTNKISSSIAGSAVEEPTSSLRNQPTVDENVTDSFDDPVYYWNDSWKVRLEQRKERFFEESTECLYTICSD